MIISLYCAVRRCKNIEVERLKEPPNFLPGVGFKVTEMGNITELQYMSNRNCKQTIKKINADEYMVLSTGEISPFKKGKTRKDNKKGLYKTFANARALINTNVTDVNCVRWCTLTYAENMTDTKRLYEDFRDFNKRFQRYCTAKGYGKAEYIVMMEPQARGAWHAHLLYIWQHTAPFIPNNDLAELWAKGFVKIKKLDNVDNVGAYLTAYLGDMEISEVTDIHKGAELKTVEIEENGKKIKKAFIKGARLDLYPKQFNMIRTSKGIKRPESKMMSREQAEKKVLGATKTFESCLSLKDEDNNFETVVYKAYYNRIRKSNQ